MFTSNAKLYLAHLNLREEYLPYKYIIGQVILDVSILVSETSQGHSSNELIRKTHGYEQL